MFNWNYFVKISAGHDCFHFGNSRILFLILLQISFYADNRDKYSIFIRIKSHLSLIHILKIPFSIFKNILVQL